MIQKLLTIAPSRVVFILISIFLVYNGEAQDIVSIRHISERNGLSDKFIFAAAQDDEGYVWMATQRGLNRFDSHNAKKFNSRNSSLRRDKIIQLVYRKGALILLYGDAGLRHNSLGIADVFFPNSFEAIPLSNYFIKMPFSESEIVSINKNSKEELLFILKGNKLWKLTMNDEFEPIKCNDCNPFGFSSSIQHLFGDKFISISSSDENKVMMLYDDQVRVISNIKDKFAIGFFKEEIILINLKNRPALANRIIGEKPIATEELSMDFPSGTPFFFNNSIIKKTLVSIRDQGIYLLEENGLELLVSANKLDLHPHQINSFFKDKNDNYWICATSGAYVISKKTNPFTAYFTAESRNRTPSIVDQVRGIYKSEKNNKLYAGIWHELGVYDLEKKQTEFLEKSLYNIIYAVQPVNEKLYFGKNSLISFDYQSKFRALLPYDDNTIWSIFQATDSTILMGTNHNVLYYNILSQNARVTNALIPLANPINIIYKIARDPGGTIWAVSSNGLYKLNAEGDIIEYFGKEEIGYSDFHDLYIDSEGIFWFASRIDGLIRWQRKENHALSFTETEGMPSNTSYCILPDDLGRLWISTDQGLVKFNKETFKVKTFSERDGLPFIEFNRISAHKAYDNTLYFGGINGIVGFNPSEIVTSENKRFEDILLTGVERFNIDKGVWEDIFATVRYDKNLVISPGQRLFNLTFSMLDFQEGNQKYSYRLEGMDNDWSMLSDNTFRLTGLPYGKYTLYVRGLNSNGDFSGEIKILDIHVLTPLYLKIEFIILMIFVLILGISGIIHYRLRRMKSEKIALENLVEERTIDLAEALDQKELLLQEIHHRVKNNLAVMDSMISLQLDKTDNAEVIQALEENQSRLRGISLIHQNLGYDHGIGKVDLEQFLEELIIHSKETLLLSGVNLSYKIAVSRPIIKASQAVPLGLMINELVTNSLKHGRVENQMLEISVLLVEKEDQRFYFEFKDNGPGIQDSKLSSKGHLGMELIFLFCKQIGGHLQYQFDNGSKFSFYFKPSN